MKARVLLLALIFCPLLAFAQNRLQSIAWRNAAKQPLTLQLQFTKTPNYRIFTLNNPNRVVIDIESVQNQLTLPSLPNPKIVKMRTGQFSPTVLRIVLETDQAFKFKSALQKQTKNYVLNVQLMPKKMTAAELKVISVLNLKPRPQNFVVVIDPGHGGKDPGAKGLFKTEEKAIVLAIAKKLQTKINQQPKMHAVLTRDDDRYLSLRERLQIARLNKADLFIAIHADAFNNALSSGVSVYTLSPRGATSEAARWLAEKENYSELSGVSWAGKSNSVKSVLLDLAQSLTLNKGMYAGTTILKQLSLMAPLHFEMVEQARFVVLKSPDIPSLLIETGFLSNRLEEQRLRDPAYQQRLADAIARGVNIYFIQDQKYVS